MNNSKQNIHTETIVIGTHSTVIVEGSALNLKKYFLKHQPTINLWWMAHPLLSIKQSYDMASECAKYENGTLQFIRHARVWHLPEPLLYIKDILYTIIWSLKIKGTIDYYFGCDTLVAFAALFLRFTGKVKHVIYYGVDYFPQRFENPIMNFIYHGIDRFCARYADETWNASGEMQKARAIKGMTGKPYSRQYTVPIGIWPDSVPKFQSRRIDQFRIFYIGLISEVMGLDLVIRSFPSLLKNYPKLKFDIVGYGPSIRELKRLVHKLHLTANIRFHGLLASGKKRALLFSRAGIGVAPFNTTIPNSPVKNADPMKLKEYTSYGIPIIVTDAISNATSISRSGCGIVIPYDEQAFIDAITHMLRDEKRYKRFCSDALRYAQRFDWDRIFTPNLQRLNLV